MLVQQRADGYRLIAQHEHALLSGALAQAWLGLDGREPAYEAALATALHDMPWREADREPRFNPQTGRPHDFLDYPSGERLALYAAGVDGLADVHPYVGLLVSLHYSSLELMSPHAEFQAAERRRRHELAAALPPELADPASQQRDLALLQLLDVLSLYLCLAPPSARRESLPRWLDPRSFARTPEGAPFQIAWRGDEKVVLDPSPLRAPVQFSLSCRDLPRDLPDAAALAHAWREAPLRHWRLSVT